MVTSRSLYSLRGKELAIEVMRFGTWVGSEVNQAS